MKLDKKEIKHLADLAKLQLTSEEIATYADQLTDVLDFVDKINKLDLKKIKESLTGVDESDIVPPRPDQVEESDPEVIKQASELRENYLVAPNVFDK
jgi:aspartyl-tRNA(Asn)/glutamyl-tRNA(Gln) amidotransferase subunit C